MMSSIHITNGDIAADLIKKLKQPNDEVIAWQDVLFEGPVPSDLSLNKLSEVRARYLSDSGYGDFTTILKNLSERNKQIAEYAKYQEIILWFEHDLYDQLQLLQILDWFSEQELVGTQLKLINIGSYPNVEPFFGFGQLSVEQMDSLFLKREAVSPLMLTLAKKAWHAFRDENPQLVESLLLTDLSVLPYLKDAMIRYLDEFPSTTNGLSRTEQYILSSINRGQNNLLDIFQRMPIEEEKYFMGMGDVSFLRIVQRLGKNKNPLITSTSFDTMNEEDIDLIFRKTKIYLTILGQKVLTGQENWIRVNPIDLWLGGVHLTPDNLWCWDHEKQKLYKNNITR